MKPDAGGNKVMDQDSGENGASAETNEVDALEADRLLSWEFILYWLVGPARPHLL